MSELPPGFVLEAPSADAPPELPPGFIVEGSPEHMQAEPHKFGLMDTWPGKIVSSVTNLAKLAGDVYAGRADPGGDDAIAASWEAAKTLTPMSAAARAGEGIFAVPIARKAGVEAPAGVQAAATANELGAPLPVGLASGSKAVQAATKAAQQLPLVGPKIGERAAATVNAAGEKVGSIADELAGGVTDRASAGASVRPSLQGVVEKNNGEIGAAYDGLRAKIDQTEPVALESTAKVVSDIIKARKAAGQTKPEAGLEDFKNLSNNGATFDGLQRARSDVGNSLNFGTANPGFNAGDLKRIYGAMSKDMEGVVSQSVKDGVKPEEAIQALRDAHATAAPLMEFNKTLNRLGNIKSDESLIGSLTKAAQDKTGNVKLLAQLRGAMPAEDFQQIAGVALSELGHNASAGRFSLNQFATKWDGLGERAKYVMFTPEHRKSLDAIAQLGKHMKDADKFANTSNTAGAASWGKVLAAAAGAGGALLLGDPTKLAAVLGTAGGGYLMASALARPATASSVAKWATAAVQASHGQTPARLAVLKIAGRNLINNLLSQGASGNQTNPLQSRKPQPR